MALNFTFNPNDYTENDFAVLPAGDYRVRIAEVTEKTFNSGNQGLEIVLSVSGKLSKLWYYLVLDPNDQKRTNQRLGDFFGSFGITNYNLNAYNTWVGKIGAVRVKNEEYQGNQTAKVAFCLSKAKAEKLPAWVEPGNAAPVQTFTALASDADDLPFD